MQDTFLRAKSWVKELQRQASPNIVIALSGNKADLASKRMVEYEVSLELEWWDNTLSFLVCRKHKFMLKKTVYYLWRLQPKLQ